MLSGILLVKTPNNPESDVDVVPTIVEAVIDDKDIALVTGKVLLKGILPIPDVLNVNALDMADCNILAVLDMLPPVTIVELLTDEVLLEVKTRPSDTALEAVLDGNPDDNNDVLGVSVELLDTANIAERLIEVATIEEGKDPQLKLELLPVGVAE